MCATEHGRRGTKNYSLLVQVLLLHIFLGVLFLLSTVRFDGGMGNKMGKSWICVGRLAWWGLAYWSARKGVDGERNM